MFNFWGMWVVVTGYGMAGGGGARIKAIQQKYANKEIN